MQGARGVEALPELALGRGALTQRHVGQLVAVGHAAGQLPAGDVAGGLGAAHGGQALAPGRARLGHHVERGVAPVARHLTAPGGRVGGRSDRLEEDLLRGDAEGQHQGPVPVVREEPVVAGTQLAAQTDEQRLVPCARDLEKDPALLLESDLPVVQVPRYPGGGEVRFQLVNRDAAKGGFRLVNRHVAQRKGHSYHSWYVAPRTVGRPSGRARPRTRRRWPPRPTPAGARPGSRCRHRRWPPESGARRDGRRRPAGQRRPPR